jgi:hypothetical protein
MFLYTNSEILKSDIQKIQTSILTIYLFQIQIALVGVNLPMRWPRTITLLLSILNMTARKHIIVVTASL